MRIERLVPVPSDWTSLLEFLGDLFDSWTSELSWAGTIFLFVLLIAMLVLCCRCCRSCLQRLAYKKKKRY